MPTVIQEQIKILVELQKIDSEIYFLKKELGSHPALKQKIESDFEKKKVHLKAAEDELKGVQLKQKQKEGDLQVKTREMPLHRLHSEKDGHRRRSQGRDEHHRVAPERLGAQLEQGVLGRLGQDAAGDPTG